MHRAGAGQAPADGNIAVHNYEAIDWEIVWLLAGDPLGDFEAFARQAALDLT